MYEVNENGVQVEVCAVIVSGDSAADVMISLETADDSALAGDDYTALSTTLTFVTPSTRTCENVDIINDQIYEIDETFFGQLMSDDSRVVIIPARQQTTIEIDDEDSKLYTAI